MKSVIEIYSEIAKKNPPWTIDEERDFIRSCLTKNGRKWKNKDRFVNEAMRHNLGLIFSAMKSLCFNKDNEDAFQKAVVAMVEALKKFSPEKKCRISTWLTNPIRWAILHHQRAYSHETDICSEISALNKRTGTKYTVVSLDSAIKEGETDGDTIGNCISTSNVNPNYIIEHHVKDFKDIERDSEIKGVVGDVVKEMVKMLDKRELFIIRGMLKGKNMTEISVELKLSKMRISQISAKAFEKIRKSKYATRLKGLLT